MRFFYKIPSFYSKDTLISGLMFFTPVFADDTLVCEITSITPSVPGLLSAQLKVQTRVRTEYEGSVISVDLEKHMNDQSFITDRIFGYGPWIRGISVPDISLCDHLTETSQYRQQFGRVSLRSSCGVPDSILLRISLKATLETLNPGSVKYSYPENGETKSVEIITEACTII